MKEYESVTRSMNANETELERATISMPSALLEEGKAKAKDQRRSFSAYVATLVERDLATAKSEAEQENEGRKEDAAA